MNKLNKKHVFGALTALTVATLAAAGPAMAQDGGANNGGGDTTRTAASNQQRGDDNSNWGWLGLLGLAGLAGLRKPAPTVVRQDKDGAARAY